MNSTISAQFRAPLFAAKTAKAKAADAETTETLKYEAHAGEWINYSARQASKMSQETGKTVTFDFNGIELTVKPDTTPEDVVKTYRDETEARAEAYRNSPEGKRATAEAEASKNKAQATVDKIVKDFPAIVAKGESAIIPTLAELALSADHVDVHADLGAVNKILMAKGYKVNDAVGLPQTEYQKPKVLARYLIGQFMNFPHPNLMDRFAKDYLNLLSSIKLPNEMQRSLAGHLLRTAKWKNVRSLAARVLRECRTDLPKPSPVSSKTLSTAGHVLAYHRPYKAQSLAGHILQEGKAKPQ